MQKTITQQGVLERRKKVAKKYLKKKLNVHSSKKNAN